jgi:hypothetical protein
MTHDWNAIRKDYEQGASLRGLAAKYHISKSTIERHMKMGQWDSGTHERDSGTVPLPQHIPLPSDATTIARIGLQQLAQHLQVETILEIKDHKSLSDALAQYVKVLVTAPQEDNGQEEEGLFIPLEKISPDTRREIRRLLAEDEQKRRVG